MIVNDYLAFGPGSTLVQINQHGGVPLSVYSSAGVREITGKFCIEKAGYFTNLTFSPAGSDICSVTFDPVSPTCYQIRITACPGKTILGSQPVAWFGFHTLPRSSAFIRLVVSEVAAVKPGGEPIPQVVPREGRVVVIGQQPLLEGWMAPTNQPMLTLYGNPGETYQISQQTNLGNTTWLPAWSVTMTNLFQTYSVDTPLPQMFYRAGPDQ